MRYYAIRQKSSGLLLPYHARPATRAEPGEGAPRLFTRKRFAKSALTRWMQSELTDTARIEPNMEVVEVELCIVSKV